MGSKGFLGSRDRVRVQIFQNGGMGNLYPFESLLVPSYFVVDSCWLS